ncbi:MAG: hypothetical protein LBU46_08585 [Candidatus Accumulibacter sp.]|nr:hypothetical protein [Accumulibacter sp.]
MYALELPSVPDNIPAFAIIAKADTQIKSDIQSIGFCKAAGYTTLEGEPENGQAGAEFDPVYGARQYFSLYKNKKIDFGSIPLDAVPLIKSPSHGKINYAESHWEYMVEYRPDPGYTGNDHVEFLVDVQGMPVRVVFFLKITQTDIARDSEGVDVLCEGRFQWKISSSTPEDYTDPTSWHHATSLLALFSEENLSFSNFPGSAVAKATGAGANAKITLDTAAAGHGWYIDYTPYLNEEYLPARSPYEWIAKPGSSAEGKINLLSVLWRELDHA